VKLWSTVSTSTLSTNPNPPRPEWTPPGSCAAEITGSVSHKTGQVALGNLISPLGGPACQNLLPILKMLAILIKEDIATSEILGI
jgi:hypothetical protein